MVTDAKAKASAALKTTSADGGAAQMDQIEKHLKDFKAVAKRLQEEEREAATDEHDAVIAKIRAATDAALGKLSGLKKGGKRARQAELDDEDGALSSDDGEEAEAPAPAPAKRRSTA